MGKCKKCGTTTSLLFNEKTGLCYDCGSVKDVGLPSEFSHASKLLCYSAPLLRVTHETFLLVSSNRSFLLLTFEDKNQRHKVPNYIEEEYLTIGKDTITYGRQGDFYVENNVQGLGGGTNYGNAIVGGLLFGPVGAIVASRKGINISTESNKIDERQTVFIFHYQNQQQVFLFDTNTYNILIKMIPERELSYVKSEAHKAGYATENKSEHKESDTNTILEQIEKLGSLRSQGILTEDEFNEKKRTLLDRL